MVKGAKLTVRGDVDNDGNREEGIFHMVGNLRISIGTRTGPIGQGGSQLWSIFSHWFEEFTGEQPPGDGKRQQLRLDLGAGTHFVEVDFSGWTGDNSHTWGDPNEPTGSKANATEGTAKEKMAVLDRYFQVSEIDSREGHAAELEVGEYSDTGRYGPLRVAPEDPTVTFNAEESSSIFSGSITFVEIASLGEAFDAEQRQE